MKHLTIIFLLITSFALGQGAANGTSLLLRENSQTQIDGFQTQSGYVRLAWNDAEGEFQYRVGSGAWQSLATGGGGGISWSTAVNSDIEPDIANTRSIGLINPFSIIKAVSISGTSVAANNISLMPLSSLGVSNGSIYYDLEDNLFYFGQNGAWVPLSSGGGWVGTATGPLDMDGNPISMIGDMTPEQTAVWTLPTATITRILNNEIVTRANAAETVDNSWFESTTAYVIDNHCDAGAAMTITLPATATITATKNWTAIKNTSDTHSVTISGNILGQAYDSSFNPIKIVSGDDVILPPLAAAKVTRVNTVWYIETNGTKQ